MFLHFTLLHITMHLSTLSSTYMFVKTNEYKFVTPYHTRKVDEIIKSNENHIQFQSNIIIRFTIFIHSHLIYTCTGWIHCTKPIIWFVWFSFRLYITLVIYQVWFVTQSYNSAVNYLTDYGLNKICVDTTCGASILPSLSHMFICIPMCQKIYAILLMCQ